MRDLAHALFLVDMRRALENSLGGHGVIASGLCKPLRNWYLMQFLEREPAVSLADLVDAALERDQALHNRAGAGAAAGAAAAARGEAGETVLSGPSLLGPPVEIPTLKRARPLVVRDGVWPSVSIMDKVGGERVPWVADDPGPGSLAEHYEDGYPSADQVEGIVVESGPGGGDGQDTTTRLARRTLE